MNGQEVTKIGLSSRGIWMMMKKGVSGESAENQEKDTERNQNWSGWS